MSSGSKRNIVELSPEQELVFEKNLIWLFGSARGGTTWVALQLLSHQTNSINEPHIDEHLGAQATEISDRFVRRIDNPQKNPEYFFSKKYRDVWIYYLRKLILNRFYAQARDLTRKTIIKELDTWGTADILTECTKNSKIIILLRDGRDVLDSLIDARTKEGFMTKEGNMTPPPANRRVFITDHSKLWVARNENFLKTYENYPKNLRYMVKYEDLLKNTFEELKKLYKFIDVDIDDNEIQKLITKFSFKNIPEKEKGKGKFYRIASPGLWKKNFSEDEKKVMDSVMGKMLQKFGYEN